MRTTLTIDDDLAGILKRRSRELGMPFKELVNAALRKGLAEATGDLATHKIRVRPHDFGETREGIDLDRLNRLADELEAERFLVEVPGK